MKTILIHCSLRPDERLAVQVREKLNKLARLARIEVAEVTFEHSAAAIPAFAVRMRLAVPGPDLHVEEKEHNLQVALNNALAKLTRLVRNRKEFLKNRRKTDVETLLAAQVSNGTVPAIPDSQPRLTPESVRGFTAQHDGSADGDAPEEKRPTTTKHCVGQYSPKPEPVRYPLGRWTTPPSHGSE